MVNYYFFDIDDFLSHKMISVTERNEYDDVSSYMFRFTRKTTIEDIEMVHGPQFILWLEEIFFNTWVNTYKNKKTLISRGFRIIKREDVNIEKIKRIISALVRSSFDFYTDLHDRQFIVLKLKYSGSFITEPEFYYYDYE